MSTEEVKFKQNVSALNGTQKASSSGSTEQKKFDANLIAEAFKKFAQKNGITLSSESFLGIINAHPEILTMSADKQASELLKLFNNEKSSDTQSKPQAEQTEAGEQAATANAADSEVVNEVLASIKQEQTLEKTRNLFANVLTSDSATSELEQNDVRPSDYIDSEPAETRELTKAEKKAAEKAAKEAEKAEKKAAKEAAKAEKAEQKAEKKAERKANWEYTKDRVKSFLNDPKAFIKQERAAYEAAGKSFSEYNRNNLKTRYNKVKEEVKTDKIKRQQTAAYKDSEKHNPADFANMNERTKLETYREAYAKNIFLSELDENGKPIHTEEDWNKLSSDEKIGLWQRAQLSVDKSSSTVNEAFALFGISTGEQNGEEGAIESTVEYKMTALQTANSLGMSVQEFEKLSPMEQLAYMADYLDGKEEGQLSNMDKMITGGSELIRDALSYALEQAGEALPEGKLSFAEMYKMMTSEEAQGEGGLHIGVVMKDYLEHLQEEGQLTDPTQQKTLEYLQKMSPENLEEFGTKPRTPLELEEAIAGDEALSEQYANATETEKAKMLVDKFVEMHMDADGNIDVAEFTKLFKEANGQARILLLAEMGKLLGKDSKVANKEELIIAAMMNTPDGTQHILQGDILKELGDNYTVVTDQLGYDNVDQNTIAALNNASDEQIKILSEHIMKNNIDASFQYGKIYGDRAIVVEDEATYDGIVADAKNTKDPSILAGLAAPHEGADIQRQNKAIEASEGRFDVTQELMENDVKPSDYDPECQDKANEVFMENAENDPDNERGKNLGTWVANDIPNLDPSVQLPAHQRAASSKHSEVAEIAAANIHKYDKSVQVEALKATYASGNEKAIQVAAQNISKMDSSVQAEAVKATFATNNTKVIETVLLQVKKMDAAAMASIQAEIDAQIAIMEERNVQSIIEAFGKRQVNKASNMTIDNNSQEFQSRLEKYIAELKNLPTSELYTRLCADIQFWPTDMQAAMLGRISKYCPKLFSMMLDKYGIKLLTAFGQIDVSTRNAILMEMLKSSGSRADAMEYLKSNPDAAYSDAVKDLYNKLLAEKEGDEYDKVKAQQKDEATDYQTAPMSFGSQSGVTKTNFISNDSYWKTKANLNYYMA